MCFRWLHFVLLAFFLEALNVSGQKDCPAPTLEDGFVVPDNETHLHGTTIYYRCEQGRKPNVGGWWATSKCHNGTWTHTPQCIDGNDCLGPEIPNSEYTPAHGWYKDGEKISINCNEGYEIGDDIATATCRHGNWTTLPICYEDLHGCTEPDEIPHAVIIDEYQTIFPDEKTVSYECEKGYSVAAGKIKSWLCALGQWEPKVAAPCVKDGVLTSPGTGPIERCGDIPNIQDGDLETLETTSLTYQCADFYELVGTAVVVCYDNGTWSQPPICRDSGQREKSCPAPKLEDGFVVPDKETHLHGTTISYRCEQGRKPNVGGWWATSKCHNGYWTHTPQCIDENDCFGPEIPNAEYTPAPGLYEDGEHSITCNEGYTARGDIATATCRRGKWTSLPICDRHSNACTEPDEIPHAVIIGEYQTTFRDGKNVSYECQKGYSVAAGKSKSMLCSSGQWIVAAPCVIILCGIPGKAEFAKWMFVKERNFNFGSEVEYNCKKGYQMMSGINKRSCTQNGMWDGVVPVCKDENGCLDPEITNAEYTTSPVGWYKDGANIAITCAERYKSRDGITTATCRHGIWTSSPICDAKRCPRPELAAGNDITIHGLPDNNGRTPVGQNLTFSCDTRGKKLNGTSVLTCGEDEKWNHPIPSCEDVTCPLPPADREIVFEHQRVKAGPILETLTFSCSPPKQLNGTSELTCNETGQWDHVFPSCEDIYCPVLSNVPNSSRTGALRAPYKHRDAVSFRCDRGYMLEGSVTISCGIDGQWSPKLPTCRWGRNRY